MRSFYFINSLFLFLLCLLIFGCAGKKDSLGTDDEIRVICSKIDEPVIKDYLASVFDDTIYTPEPEPLFKLIFSRPERYEDLKEYAQVIIAAVNRDSTNPGYRLLKKLLPEGQLNNSEDDNPVLLTRDLHAKDQVYAVINASNKEHLFNYLDKNKGLLRKHYDEQFKLRGSRFLFNDNQTQIEEKIKEDYGWFLKIPWGWEVLRNEDKMNFFWMGSEYPYRWMSIKWDSGNNINDELSLGKQIWNFPINHYKSIRFNENRFKLDRIYFNDYKGWQCSGIWESMDSLDAKGGPFYSYIFYDHHSDRTFHINTLVHNPGKSKAVYIRKMELIAKSFRSIVREKI